jgi:hemolysin-activating ACP:hemolysin acyltransferase
VYSNVEKDLTDYKMESKVINLYDCLEKVIKKLYKSESNKQAILISRVWLYKSMYMYKHNNETKALQNLLKIINFFQLSVLSDDGKKNSVINCSIVLFKICDKLLVDKY